MKSIKLCALAAFAISFLFSCGKTEEEKAAQQAKEAANRLDSVAKDAAKKLEEANQVSGNASEKAQKDLQEAKKKIEDATKSLPPVTPPPVPPGASPP